MGKNKDQTRRKITKCYLTRTRYRNLRNYFEECTSYSSLHGIKYLGESNRTLAEKIGWFVIIVISMVACAYFVLQTYRKWETTPILVSVGTTQLPIQYVTFPAVTICPAAKLNKHLMDLLQKFSKNYGSNVTLEEKLAFKHTQMWCQYKNYSGFANTYKLSENYTLDALDFIFKNSPAINETFWKCEWSGDQNIPCSELFTPTFTEEGICFTFNSVNRSDLFEKGVLPYKHFNTARNTACYDDYSSDCSVTYPYRTTPGMEAGLQIIMRTHKDNVSPCIDTSKGHKVIIHLPNELPSSKYDFFYMPLTESVTVGLSPQVIITDESLRSYTVEQRKCYYDDEKNLTHFKYYTQKNCETQCYLYATNLYLNCSDFYMPHIDRDTTICNATNTYTLRKIGHHLKNYLANLNLNIPSNILSTLESEEVPDNAKDICSCLPSCRFLKYNAEVTQTTYDVNDKPEKDIENENMSYSKLHIYFKDAQFLPYERKEMFGLMDFVAYCGGLLGLFIGFSFIALLEILYFISFRPLCNMFLYGKKFCTGIYKLEVTSGQEEHLSSE